MAFIRNDSIVVNGVSCKAYPPSSPVAGHISSNSDNLITDVSFIDNTPQLPTNNANPINNNNNQ